MNVAIFISGTGSLLQSFVDFAVEHDDFKISAVVADRQCLGIARAENLGLNVQLYTKCDQTLVDYLTDLGVDLVCLAGFLQIIPSSFIGDFGGVILNTHPSLIPKFCGTGFYGNKVHEAVLESGEVESGITIHEVTKDVDCGPIVFQKVCPVYPDDTVEILRNRVQKLEREWYPKIAYDYSKQKLTE